MVSIYDGDESVDIYMNYNSISSDYPEIDIKKAEAKVTLPVSDKTLKIIGDRNISRLLSLNLLDRLPIVGKVGVKYLKRNQSFSYTLKLAEVKAGILPISSYNIFSIKYDTESKLWIPNVVGTADLIDSFSKRRIKKGGKRKHRWKVALKKGVKLSPDRTYWIQDAQGRGQNSKLLDSSIDRSLDKYGLSRGYLDRLVFDTFSNGYVGVRYGYSIMKGNRLISESHLISALVDIRSGPLKGLRWYWDVVPETTQIIDGQKFYFKWNRPSVGWAFAVDIDFGPFSTLDFSPRIGALDLDAVLPTDNNENQTQPLRFRIKNAVSFGLEAGLEKQTNLFLARFWGGGDIALGSLSGSKSTHTTIRSGIDTYWRIIKLKNFPDFALLVFLLGERTTMEKEVDPEDENVSISGINFNLLYGGIGATISW